MKTIPLTQDKVALVSDRDYKRVSQFKWCAKKKPHDRTWYAVRSLSIAEKSENNRSEISLHQFIMNAGNGEEVDHRDGNGLNCQRRNIRKCNRLQNTQNQGIRLDNTSGYKGVARVSEHSRQWKAYIKRDGRQIHLGVFSNPTDAALAYNRAAKKYFGRFAYLNKTPET